MLNRERQERMRLPWKPARDVSQARTNVKVGVRVHVDPQQDGQGEDSSGENVIENKRQPLGTFWELELDFFLAQQFWFYFCMKTEGSLRGSVCARMHLCPMLPRKLAKGLQIDFPNQKGSFQAVNSILMLIIQQQRRTEIPLKLEQSKSGCSQWVGENVILSSSKLQLLKACMVNQRSITVTQSSGGREGADRRQAQRDQKQRIPRAQKRLTPFNHWRCRLNSARCFGPRNYWCQRETAAHIVSLGEKLQNKDPVSQSVQHYCGFTVSLREHGRNMETTQT